MIWKLFLKFASRLPRRVIPGEDGSAYLTRYFLLRQPWLQIYLHEFHRSDSDRDCHDHPWRFVSIILAGGYWEDTPHPDTTDPITRNFRQRKWYQPGSVLFRPASWLHRVEIDESRKPWSLVIVGSRIRKWGFQTPEGWIYWKDYLRAKGMEVPETGE